MRAMPTGYTHAVGDGTLTDFTEFAWRCARQFGPLISMRDEPINAPVPERFEPNDRYRKELEESKAKLAAIESLTDSAANIEAELAHRQSYFQWHKRRSRRLITKQRYEVMLRKVSEWHPPSADHAKLKDFMVEQLTSSIDWDCNGEDTDPEPQQVSGHTWKSDQIRYLKQRIETLEREHAADVERTETRNDWVRLLRESLEATAAA